MSTPLEQRIASGDVLVGDGAMGSELFRAGLSPDHPPEIWLLENPAAIQKVHESYVNSGSDWLLTNTFGANPIRLFEHSHEQDTIRLNRIAVELAKIAAQGKCFVLGDMGPSGLYLPPQGSTSPQDITRAYTLQAQALHDGGVDGFMIETMLDTEEVKCIVEAIRSVSDQPILASICARQRETQWESIVGVPIAECVRVMEAMGVVSVGSNCMAGADVYPDIVREIRAAATLPIVVQPNAGQPYRIGERLEYPQTSNDFLSQMNAIHAAGARLIGGCCGTTPQTIAGIRSWADALR